MRLILILTLQVLIPNATGFVSNRFGTFNTRTATTATPTSLFDAPEPLAEEGSWQAFLDEENTGLIYYFDVKTGESLWEPPTPTFPEVRLSRKKQRLADNLRREYRRNRQQERKKEISEGKKSKWQIKDTLILIIVLLF